MLDAMNHSSSTNPKNLLVSTTNIVRWLRKKMGTCVVDKSIKLCRAMFDVILG